MKVNERVVWVIFLIIIIATFFFSNQEYKDRVRGLEQRNIEMAEENKRLQEINEDNMATIEDLRSEIEKYNKIVEDRNFNDGVIMSPLREKGFTGKLEDIVSDLQTHSELIPYEGGLGGTMGFYSDKNIHVLTDKWVLAYFEDGHIFGYMLLEYGIEDGNIVWEVIDSYLFE